MTLKRLEPHVLPFTKLVDSMRSRGLATPDVDPNDGGINAKVLFFLETPGHKAVNGLVSRDNPWFGPCGNAKGALVPSALLRPPRRRTWSRSSRYNRLSFLWFTSAPS